MRILRFFLLGILLLGCLISEIKPAVAETAEINLRQSPYMILAAEDNWKWSPAVAYDPDHDAYLVVWEDVWPGTNHHNIYGRLVTAGGLMSPDFLIADDINNSLQPDVAYDNIHDRYLVVWAYDAAGDGLDGDIYGRFIPWNAPYPNPEQPFGIDESRANSDKPRLAYSPTSDEFLIVWKVETLDPAPYIAGGIIKSDKTGFPVAISSGSEARDFPVVAYNLATNDFLVAWDVDVTRTNYDLDIYAVRIYANGAHVPPGEFAVATLPQVEEQPSVAACYNAYNYFIVWSQQVNTVSDDYNIFGRMMDVAGTLGQSYGVAGTTLPQRHPSVSCNPAGSEYILAWDDMYAQPLKRVGIWAEAVSTSFWVQSAFEVVRPSDNKDRQFPAVANGKVTALVVWQHQRENSGYFDIWAQLVQPHALFLPTIRK